MTSASDFKYSVLTDSFIRYRRVSDGKTQNASLPQLFIALAADEVRDYPSLRAHQSHPWHAFLVHLAAIALHEAGRTTAFQTSDQWRDALLALTPCDPDGAAWCLVSPPDRPALLQAAVEGNLLATWKSESFSADEIDMLVTSKNHDLKGRRAYRSCPEDWLFSLLSLQTQEGFLGAGNYGISRMNGGFASRPSVGIAAVGQHGSRWLRDFKILLTQREQISNERGLKNNGGLALVWLVPWDGLTSLAFSALDPLYIEVCRRIRLQAIGDEIKSIGTGSKVPRIVAKDLNGLTGDAWTPIDVAAGKALTITATGFNYKLVSELMFGTKYQPPAAQGLTKALQEKELVLILKGVTRGQGKTEGYHERRVPISPKVRSLLLANQKAPLAQIAAQRIAIIGEIRALLWTSLKVLFANGNLNDKNEGNKTKASKFSASFEGAEDSRFFEDLNDEMEATDPIAQRLHWTLELVDRADRILREAFDSGPRSGAQRYRAQSAALSRFHGILRSEKSPIPDLASHYRQQKDQRQENFLDHA